MEGIPEEELSCCCRMYLQVGVPAESRDTASIGRPGNGVGIPSLTKKKGTLITCFYVPDLYTAVASRRSDTCAVGRPCQSIHFQVARCKKGGDFFAGW